MKISAKFNEVETELFLHSTQNWDIKRIMETSSNAIDTIEVIVCRKQPPQKLNGRSLENWQIYHDLNWHRVRIKYKTVGLPVIIQVTSLRLNQNQIRKLGLIPNEKAIEKENKHRTLLKLAGNENQIQWWESENQS